MASITRSLLRRWYFPGNGLRILDAGCGTGAAMTTYLAEYGSVTGCDISPLALSFSLQRGADRLLQASVLHLPFPARTFDLVASFDVLYHAAVTDDASAIRELARVLAPGGRLLLRLPAYDWLRGSHDRVIHTARRYTVSRVKRLLAAGGLTVELVSYANTVLFPIALIKRVSERMFPCKTLQSDLLLDPGSLNNLLAWLLACEAPLVKRGLLPYGLSVFAVGRQTG